MLAACEFAAAFCTVMFTGAALYISLVEHPTRMLFETRLAAMFWEPSYRRATLMQASLALIACASGLLAWSLGGGQRWLAVALIIGAVVPFTLVVIKPTNNRLREIGRDLTSPETRRLLERWGWLHAVRAVAGLVSTTVLLGFLLGGS